MITQQQIQDQIKCVELHKFRGTNTIACALSTHAGFTVVGVSHCLDGVDFDANLGMRLARENAEQKLAHALAAAVAFGRHTPTQQLLFAEGAKHEH